MRHITDNIGLLNILLTGRESMQSNTNLNKITEITDTNTNTSYDNLRLIDTFVDAFASSIEFYSRLNSAFIDALSVPFSDAQNQIKDIRKEIMPDKDLL